MLHIRTQHLHPPPPPPQLSKRYPAGESSVCETTGQHTIGHVRLGARQRGVTVDSIAAEDGSEGRQDVGGAERCIGEPQLTTCTNK